MSPGALSTRGARPEFRGTRRVPRRGCLCVTPMSGQVDHRLAGEEAVASGGRHSRHPAPWAPASVLSSQVHGRGQVARYQRAPRNASGSLPPGLDIELISSIGRPALHLERQDGFPPGGMASDSGWGGPGGWGEVEKWWMKVVKRLRERPGASGMAGPGAGGAFDAPRRRC